VSMTADGMPPVVVTPEQRRTRLARRALAARGLLEAVTWSFMPSDLADLFGGGDAGLRLANPIASDLDTMRPSVLPNLVMAAQRNADRGHPDVALFEVGPQYGGVEPDDQALVATGIRFGRSGPRHWDAAPRAVDVFDAKADALAALEAAGAPVANAQTTADAPGWYHPGRSGVLRLGNKVLAAFGELHPRVLRRLDVKAPVVGFEVMLDNLPPPKAKASKTRPLLKPSPFQPVERDFAFVVADDVPAEKLVRAAQGADKALIDGVSVFDVYAGEGIGAGKKSVAIAVRLQPTDATLTEEQIEAVAEKVVANVAKQTGGVLRS
jgi:phenylalanyl-tRNA synthetase beta chain